jgi:hypothetical protein
MLNRPITKNVPRRLDPLGVLTARVEKIFRNNLSNNFIERGADIRARDLLFEPHRRRAPSHANRPILGKKYSF